MKKTGNGTVILTNKDGLIYCKNFRLSDKHFNQLRDFFSETFCWWNKEEKSRVIPWSPCLNELRQLLKEMQKDGVKVIVQNVEEKTVNEKIPVNVLYEFQKEGVRHVIRCFKEGLKGALIADEMGLGKTIQALASAWMITGSLQHVTVFCPAFLVPKWKTEARRWFPHESLPEVVSYGKVSTNPDLVKKHIHSRVVILDEAHYLKNPRAERTKALHKLAAESDAFFILLTGTPLVKNDPREVYSLLCFLCSPKLPLGKFLHRYAVFEDVPGRLGKKRIAGIRKTEELKEWLGYYTVRRLVKDVLPQLPPLTADEYVIELDYDEVAKAEAEIEKEISEKAKTKLEHLLDRLGEFAETYVKSGSLAVEEQEKKLILFALSRAKETTGLLKARNTAFQEFLKHQLDEVSHLTVFCVHKSVVSEITSFLEKQGAAVHVLTGDVAASKRQDVLDEFRRKGGVLVATVGSAGVGIDLDFCRRAVFAELPWSPAEIVQAEKRLHRLTTTEPVYVTYTTTACSPFSIEEKVLTVLKGKLEAFKNVVGSVISSSPSEEVLKR